jgi:hypothetical protein
MRIDWMAGCSAVAIVIFVHSAFLATLQCTAPAWVPYDRIDSQRLHYWLMYGTEPVPYI